MTRFWNPAPTLVLGMLLVSAQLACAWPQPPAGTASAAMDCRACCCAAVGNGPGAKNHGRCGCIEIPRAPTSLPATIVAPEGKLAASGPASLEASIPAPPRVRHAARIAALDPPEPSPIGSAGPRAPPSRA